MSNEEMFRHLTVRNRGLNLNGCILMDRQDLPTNTRNTVQHKLLIFELDQVAMEHLKPREGHVFFDLEEFQGQN